MLVQISAVLDDLCQEYMIDRLRDIYYPCRIAKDVAIIILIDSCAYIHI